MPPSSQQRAIARRGKPDTRCSAAVTTASISTRETVLFMTLHKGRAACFVAARAAAWAMAGCAGGSGGTRVTMSYVSGSATGLSTGGQDGGQGGAEGQAPPAPSLLGTGSSSAAPAAPATTAPGP